VHFCIFEPSCIISDSLILKFWVFSNADKGASSKLEVLDHQFSKPIKWVIHFIVEEESEIEGLCDVGNKFIDVFSVDVTEDTFAVE
jgi:hypothetical protein